MTAHAYSFADVNATLIGPGAAIILGNSSGVADEGITIEPSEDVGTMLPGADGQVMFSLHAARPARITVRLLKTSPSNALLGIAFNLQTSSASLYGQNTIAVSDIARGDIVTLLTCAFSKFPGITWAKDGNMNEWIFNCGQVSWALGSGNGT